MRTDLRSPWVLVAVVLGWRFLLLLSTGQPVPGNDAFLFDGPVVNWLLHRQYFNPSLAECFPISGHEVFAAYPPIYQALLLPWMWAFGTSAVSAMWFHFLCFCAAGILAVKVLTLAWDRNRTCSVRPAGENIDRENWLGLAVLLLFAVTFDDRPEGLAHVFGLLGILLSVEDRTKANGGVARQDGKWQMAKTAGVVLALFCSLFTSLVAGAFYCAVTMLARVLDSARCRRGLPWGVGVGVVSLFGVVTFWIYKAHPLWWQGFLENAHQTPVSTTGFRVPEAAEVIKIVRNAPVFFLGLVFVPPLLRAWRRPGAGAGSSETASAEQGTLGCSGPALALAVLLSGWLLLVGCLLLFSANYVNYLWHAQVLLAGGLISVAPGLRVGSRRLFIAALACCLALVSVRAVGMTTWGAVCATDVSYVRAQWIVRKELEPFAASGLRPVVSSAFLYEAAGIGVSSAIHADWPYDRRGQPSGSELVLMNRLRPPKLILTQFDYYRIYAGLVQEVGRHPELCSVAVRNSAGVPAPDAFPALQRVLQNVSWAPVIVDFQWK